MANVIKRTQVSEDVIKIISAFTNLKPEQIKDAFILSQPPLSFDSTGLAFLALSLRGYVKSKNDQQTITATEVRKSGLTVGALIDLIFQKINS